MDFAVLDVSFAPRVAEKATAKEKQTLLARTQSPKKRGNHICVFFLCAPFSRGRLVVEDSFALQKLAKKYCYETSEVITITRGKQTMNVEDHTFCVAEPCFLFCRSFLYQRSR